MEASSQPGRGSGCGGSRGAPCQAGDVPGLPCDLGLDDDEVAQLARAVLPDRNAAVSRWWLEPVDYPFGSPTTGGLFRVLGTAAVRGATAPWSVFVKVLRSYRLWPALRFLPAAERERALNSAVWRYEADVYAHGLGGALPAGLRLPRLYAMRYLDGDRIALVMEDVRTTSRHGTPRGSPDPASCSAAWPRD